MSITSISYTDRINSIGLSPDVRLHVTLLSNSLRLAAEGVELVEAAAQAKGFIAGLLIGKAISEPQHEQLQGVFNGLARLTKSQHAAANCKEPTID